MLFRSSSDPAPPAGKEGTLDEAIAALKAGDNSFKALYWPLRTIKRGPAVAKRKEEVAGLLDPILILESLSLRRAAQEAILIWGTKKNVPTLLKLLEYNDYGDKDAAIKGLGAVGGTKESAKALAGRLNESSHRSATIAALKQMGPFAEDVIWQHIGSSDNSVHDAACKVLGQVGTAKSLTKLRNLRPESDSSRRSDVNNAIQEMEKRLVRR